MLVGPVEKVVDLVAELVCVKLKSNDLSIGASQAVVCVFAHTKRGLLRKETTVFSEALRLIGNTLSVVALVPETSFSELVESAIFTPDRY